MTPAAIAQLLRDAGPYGVSGLAIAAMTVVFALFKSAMSARIADLKEQLVAAQAETSTAREAFRGHLADANARTQAARDGETAALKSVIPVAQQMLAAISVAETKRRRHADVALPAESTK